MLVEALVSIEFAIRPWSYRARARWRGKTQGSRDGYRCSGDSNNTIQSSSFVCSDCAGERSCESAVHKKSTLGPRK